MRTGWRLRPIIEHAGRRVLSCRGAGVASGELRYGVAQPSNNRPRVMTRTHHRERLRPGFDRSDECLREAGAHGDGSRIGSGSARRGSRRARLSCNPGLRGGEAGGGMVIDDSWRETRARRSPSLAASCDSILPCGRPARSKELGKTGRSDIPPIHGGYGVGI